MTWRTRKRGTSRQIGNTFMIGLGKKLPQKKKLPMKFSIKFATTITKKELENKILEFCVDAGVEPPKLILTEETKIPTGGYSIKFHAVDLPSRILRNRLMALTTLYHELGHMVRLKGKNVDSITQEEIIEEEKKAWKIGDPYIRKHVKSYPSAAWIRRHAMESTLGRT